MTSLDSFKCRKTLKVGGKTYVYYSLPTAEKNGLKGISKLPYSMKVLLENLLRNEDDRTVKKEDIQAVSKWLKKRALEHEVAFRPARVLMQDFTGVPAVVDLAAMRDAMKNLGGDPKKINPLVPVDAKRAQRRGDVLADLVAVHAVDDHVMADEVPAPARNVARIAAPRRHDGPVVGRDVGGAPHIEHDRRLRGAEPLVKLAWCDGNPGSVHAQSPRETECCAALGRSAV